MRPIVNAMVGPKKSLSERFSEVMENVLSTVEEDIICTSTEELLHYFENHNTKTKYNSEDKNKNGHPENNRFHGCCFTLSKY